MSLTNNLLHASDSNRPIRKKIFLLSNSIKNFKSLPLVLFIILLTMPLVKGMTISINFSLRQVK